MVDSAVAPVVKTQLPRMALRNHLQMLSKSDAELSRVDPVQMNLLVAKSIPSLSRLDIGYYQSLADEYAEGVRKRIPYAEKVFWKAPSRFENDLNFLGLAVLAEHLDRSVGIKYKEEHANLKKIKYTDPSDLFLNGLMDTKQGNCASMPVLFIAVAWRLGWPLSLACAGGHWFCRYDDGRVTYNLEATHSGLGGFSTPTDEEYRQNHKLPARAVSAGSDLRALKPREILGIFLGLRGRHMWDIGNRVEAEKDYLLARYLFPTNRHLYNQSIGTTVLHGAELFESNEKGSPLTLAEWIFHSMMLGIPPQIDGVQEGLFSVIDAVATLKR